MMMYLKMLLHIEIQLDGKENAQEMQILSHVVEIRKVC